MSTTVSTNLSYPIPGAQIVDTRLGDIQAVKSALVAIDAAVANADLNKANVNGDLTKDFSVKNLNIAGDILPTTNSTKSIGSETNRFKAIYVDEAYLSTNTLYLGDTAVLGTTADTVNIKADPGQSINVKTTGVGNTLITSEQGVNITSTGSNNDVLLQALGTGGQVRFGANQSIELTAPTTNVHGNSSVDGNQSVTGNLTVTGNLVLNGSTTTVSSTTVTTSDNIIEINKGQVGSGVSAGKAGLSVDRGDEPVYQMVFDETDDMFKVGMVGQLQTIASQNYVVATAAPLVHGHTEATTTAGGFMSATDKTALNSVVTNLATEINNRTVAVSNEVIDRNAAISTGDAATLVSANTYSDTLVTTEVTNRDTAIASAVEMLIGTATGAADTLGKLQGLITGNNSGTNTGDETTATIKTKLNITTLSGSNTGDQVLPTTLPASDVFAWAKNVLKPSYTAAEVGLGNVDNTADSVKAVASAGTVPFTGVSGKPTTIAGYGITDAYNKTETDSRIQAVVGAAPAALDTLAEITTQLANDESAVSALTTTVAGKANSSHGHAAVSTTVDGFMSAADKVKLNAILGTNTGDETTATIKTKLGITTLSGSNTGDQVLPTTLPASDVYAWAKASTKPGYTGAEITTSVATLANDIEVAKELRWKHYGNGHVIIDASNGTAPNGAAINNTNSAAQWTGTYPTLMGWNGSATYGVRVDWSRQADFVTSTNSQTVAGLTNTGISYLRAVGANEWQIQFQTSAGAITSYIGSSASAAFRVLNAAANQWSFLVDQVGNATAAANVSAYSDERLKKNWRPVCDDFVNKLANVKSGIYDRTDVELTQVGVSAQSLQEVLPEAVLTNEGDMLSVTYGNAALLVCIELAKEIQSLKAEISLLKAR